MNSRAQHNPMYDLQKHEKEDEIERGLNSRLAYIPDLSPQAEHNDSNNSSTPLYNHRFSNTFPSPHYKTQIFDPLYTQELLFFQVRRILTAVSIPRSAAREKMSQSEV